MKRHSPSRVTTAVVRARVTLLGALAAALGAGGCAPAPVAPPDDRAAFTLRFKGMVGEQPLTTSGPEAATAEPTYAGVGQDARTIRPFDCRFYVHDVRLLSDGGQETPLALDQTAWQYQNLALIDLDAGTTPELNDAVSGRAPKGSYRGVRFVLGVPAALNHFDAAQGPAPTGAPHPILAWDNHATSMGWSWMTGLKYAKLEFAVTQTGGTEKKFYFHLGGTGATNPTKQDGTYAGFEPGKTLLSSPNLATVTLTGFDPTTEPIVADLGAFLANVVLADGGSFTPTGAPMVMGTGTAMTGSTAMTGGMAMPDGTAMASPPAPTNAPDLLLANLGLKGGAQRLFRTATKR